MRVQLQSVRAQWIIIHGVVVVITLYSTSRAWPLVSHSSLKCFRTYSYPLAASSSMALAWPLVSFAALGYLAEAQGTGTYVC